MQLLNQINYSIQLDWLITGLLGIVGGIIQLYVSFRQLVTRVNSLEVERKELTEKLEQIGNDVQFIKGKLTK